jgi:hypothetical protein
MVIRKRFRVLSLAAIIAAAAVPFGFALSLPSDPIVTRPELRVVSATSTSVRMLPLVAGPQRGESLLGPYSFDNVSDEARLFIMGAALFGIAAAVRKSAP